MKSKDISRISNMPTIYFSESMGICEKDFSDGKASACNAGGPASIPGSGRSPGEGNGNPLQYSCLENSMDGGAWWATVHGVAKSRMRLNDFSLFRAIFTKQCRAM